MRLMEYLRARENPYSPRVHANGFIQVDITPSVRLHVWGDDRIPRQRVPTPIHDHAFQFTSRVLLGALTQRTYVLHPSGAAYQPHQARVRRGEDTMLVPEGVPVQLAVHGSVVLSAGDVADAVYSMAPWEIHETIPLGPAVSVIVKRGLTISQGGVSPTVFVPVGLAPSYEFDRHAVLSPRDMWGIVDDVVRFEVEAVATGLLWALWANTVSSQVLR